jgi:tRNA pseudouridine55 synthase
MRSELPSGSGLRASTGRRRRGQPVDGVLLLDKPQGMTSNAALQSAKRLLDAAKAGHTGTLDPIATGLLPLCFGEATKFSGYLLDADKAYTARLKLGVRTTTGDSEGETMAVRPVAVDVARLNAALERFRGDIDQIPPMHSALKREGRPLYEYARAGVEVERAARRVTIHSLIWRDLAGDELTIDVVCSKGTYVRVLAEDIGEALGCGAHLVALRRTAIGPFRAADAMTLDALAGLATEERRDALRPIDSLIGRLPEVRVAGALAEAFQRGQAVPGGARPGETVRVYADDRLLGVAEGLPDGRLQPRRVVLPGPTA